MNKKSIFRRVLALVLTICMILTSNAFVVLAEDVYFTEDVASAEAAYSEEPAEVFNEDVEVNDEAFDEAAFVEEDIQQEADFVEEGVDEQETVTEDVAYGVDDATMDLLTSDVVTESYDQVETAAVDQDYGPVVKAAEVDGVQYELLGDAFDAARNKDGATIKLLTDYDLDADDNLCLTSNTTLDLDGHVLSNGQNSKLYTVGVIAGTLTITGNGEIINNTFGGENKASAIYLTGGSLIVNNSKLTGAEYAILAENAPSLEVKDGTIEGGINGIEFLNSSALTISGGTITGVEYGVKSTTTSVPNISITGGRFTGNDYAFYANQGDHFISGGTYSTNPDYLGDRASDYLEDGYIAKRNDDGTFTVTQGTAVCEFRSGEFKGKYENFSDAVTDFFKQTSETKEPITLLANIGSEDKPYQLTEDQNDLEVYKNGFELNIAPPEGYVFVDQQGDQQGDQQQQNPDAQSGDQPEVPTIYHFEKAYTIKLTSSPVEGAYEGIYAPQLLVGIGELKKELGNRTKGDGIIEEQVVNSAIITIAAANPADGYLFDGWYEADGTDAVTKDLVYCTEQSISADIDLVAKYVKCVAAIYRGQDQVQYFTTFEDAVDARQDGDIITLLADIEDPYELTEEKSPVTVANVKEEATTKKPIQEEEPKKYSLTVVSGVQGKDVKVTRAEEGGSTTYSLGEKVTITVSNSPVEGAPKSPWVNVDGTYYGEDENPTVVVDAFKGSGVHIVSQEPAEGYAFDGWYEEDGKTPYAGANGRHLIGSDADLADLTANITAVAKYAKEISIKVPEDFTVKLGDALDKKAIIDRVKTELGDDAKGIDWDNADISCDYESQLALGKVKVGDGYYLTLTGIEALDGYVIKENEKGIVTVVYKEFTYSFDTDGKFVLPDDEKSLVVTSATGRDDLHPHSMKEGTLLTNTEDDKQYYFVGWHDPADEANPRSVVVGEDWKDYPKADEGDKTFKAIYAVAHIGETYYETLAEAGKAYFDTEAASRKAIRMVAPVYDEKDTIELTKENNTLRVVESAEEKDDRKLSIQKNLVIPVNYELAVEGPDQYHCTTYSIKAIYTITVSSDPAEATTKSPWIHLNGEKYGEEEGKTSAGVNGLEGWPVHIVAQSAAPGFKFDGWYEEDGKTPYAGANDRHLIGSDTEEAKLASDITAVAKYSPIEYTLEINLNGGSLADGVTNPETYKVTDGEVTLNNPTKTGYKFVGWSGFGVPSGQTAETITLSKELIASDKPKEGNILWFNANWEIEKYTYTFYLSEEDYDNKKVDGTVGPLTIEQTPFTVENPYDPSSVPEFYTFGGWYEATDESKTPVDFREIKQFDSDKDFIAIWTPIEYKVNVVSQYDEGKTNLKTEQQTATIGTEIKAEEFAGFAFDVWAYSVNGSSTPATSTEETITITEDLLKNVVMSEGEFNLYANYKLVEYTLTVDANGGKMVYEEKEVEKIETKLDVTTEFEVPTPVKTGYTLAGWTLHIEGKDDTEVGPNLTVKDMTEDRTYTAKWDETVYTIQYDIEAKTNPTTYQASDKEVVLNAPTAETPGYDFVKWTYKTPEGETKDIKSLTLDVVAANVDEGNILELISVYELHQYTYRYVNVDGAKYAEAYTDVNGKEHAVDEAISADKENYTKKSALDTALPTNITKDGYEFDGWTKGTKAGGKKATIFKDDSDALANRAFYANWTPIKYTIAYVDEEGKAVKTKNVTTFTVETEPYKLTKPANKTGYDKGSGKWMVKLSGQGDDDFEVEELTADLVVARADENNVLTLTATWTPTEYSFRFTNAEGAVYDGDYELGKVSKVTFNDGEEVLNSKYYYTIEDGEMYLPTIKRDGYTFKGWTTGTKAGGSDVKSFPGKTLANRGFWANWTAIQYKIKYVDEDGKTVKTDSPSKYNLDQGTVTLKPGKITGKTFSNWVVGDEEMVVEALDEEIIGYAEGNTITLVAKTETDTYTYRFVNANGLEGTYYIGDQEETITFSDGKKYTYDVNTPEITLPEDVVKPHYNFLGWTTGTQAGGDPVASFAGGSVGNRGFFANWEEIVYDVEYLNQDGSRILNSGNPIEYKVSDGTKDLNDPEEQTGLKFTGWVVLGDEGNEEDISALKAEYFTDDESKKLIVYATWEPEQYTYRYVNAEGALYAEEYYDAWDDVHYEDDEVSDLKSYYDVWSPKTALPKIKKDGYVFINWTAGTEPGGNEVKEFAGGTTGDRAFYANWAPIEYTVEYQLEDGTVLEDTGNPTDYQVEFDDFELLPAEVKGYDFKYWTADGITTVEYLDKDVIQYANEKNKIVLTAVEEPHVYTYRYDNVLKAKYAEDYDPDDYAKKNDEVSTDYFYYTILTAKRDLPKIKRKGYTFDKWTNTKGEEITSYAGGGIGNRLFTANWTIIEYPLTYTGLEGATVDPENPTSYTIETETFTLTNPTKPGYKFLGWKDAEGNVSEEVTIKQGSTGEREYDATWEIITYHIRYDLDGGKWAKAEDERVGYRVNSSDFTLAKPVKDNYVFIGWTGEDLEEPTLEVTIPTGSTGDRRYTANWIPALYTVVYTGADAGTNPASYVPVKEDGTPNVVELEAPAEKTGYTGEWQLVKGEDVKTVTELTPEDAQAYAVVEGETATLTVNAKYTAIRYTITYNGLEGAAVSPANPTEYTIETETFTLNNPTKLGTNFKGWSGTDITGKSMSVEIAKGSTGNREYTANFGPLGIYRVNLSVDGNFGGTVSKNEDKELYDRKEEVDCIATPISDDYEFDGWYDPDGKLITRDPVYKIRVYDDVNLVAKFVAVN